MAGKPKHTSSRRGSSALERAKSFAQEAERVDQIGFEHDLTQEIILERYIGLVHQIVNSLRSAWSIGFNQVDDMLADGQLGLLEAYNRFDSNYGNSFSTFAYYRIKGSVVDGLRKAGVIRRRQQPLVALADAANIIEEDRRSDGPVPSDFGYAINNVDKTIQNTGIAWLLVHESRAQAAEDAAKRAPGQRIFEAETRQQLKDALKTLTKMELEVIDGFYFKKTTLTKLARKHKYSRSWLCRVHARALQKLAAEMSDAPIPESETESES